ncbi:LysM domain-containing protein [Hyphococcus flavus]|uniref:LysM domain-containing protein n=1 Tax=Hyphococcus flavus TaxID=1866326 RepID=A0AAE9ZB00_9PROT|nr:LysM domain-containing protein [Hyphococcus flavus]WDI31164.1 LysM domain-containing protein [Hyphococcus flavus]
MGSTLAMRRMLTGAVFIAGFAAASPAMAGRCGHSYAVDTPTTLAKVARACNVSYAALAEANRGVDPGYVRPGQHLAVPDEIDNPSDPAAPAPVVDPVETSPSVQHPYIASRPVNSYRSYYDDREQVRRINASANREATTYFDTVGVSPVHTRRESRLSYQKLAAARIRAAGAPATPTTIAPVAAPVMGGALKTTTISAYPTPLMECSVLRRQQDGKIRQVREVKPVPNGEETPLHCTSLKATAPRRVILSRGAAAPVTQVRGDDLTVLRGFVSAVDDQCVTLRADDGMTWRMQAPVAAHDMLGKEATVWAQSTRALQCGGLVLDHAVYAEKL